MKSLELTYFLIATVIWLLGYFHNGRFVRPKWKIPGKFIFYIGVSLALAHWFGRWALVFLIGHPLIGLLFHIRICWKYQIDWLSCEPREKYLALQEKWASGDFSDSTES